jgi:hydrogenase maturation protein HypF
MMAEPQIIHKRITLTGMVQGVGFRPFVYRLAKELGLTGWVANTRQGATIEIEGNPEALQIFFSRLMSELPPLASIHSYEFQDAPVQNLAAFEIVPSDEQGHVSAFLLPDIATCPECLKEIFDPRNRRYRYPFTNCTNCGPRYSIIRKLPYDRCHTTMAVFEMCPDCKREYEEPANRRFHAQPNACPVCGPELRLLDSHGVCLARRDEALQAAAAAILAGKIVAVKGIGGFQLVCDARNDTAVRELRLRKRREEKPFALMVRNINAAKELCCVSDEEAQLLASPESPIVILERRDGAENRVTQSVAPRNPSLGLMLPYSPLHHLLLAEVNCPVVATSGNVTDEPICIRTAEALERLGGIADLFLTHNRPIERFVDDSVVRIIAGKAVVLRRARGFAPMPVADLASPAPTLVAFGSHLKNSVALNIGSHVVLSHHIGDLDTDLAVQAHEKTVRMLVELYGVALDAVACDKHPDYVSSRTARDFAGKRPCIEVQHHHAHALACMADNNILHQEALAVVWDGTGLGLDKTIWGSEFFLVSPRGFQRLAHFRSFRIPGGDRAMREPRRAAFGLLAELLGAADACQWFINNRPELFAPAELPLFSKMVSSGLNSPWTCGAGRLFDALAALLGVRGQCSYEGQAAMELEWLACGSRENTEGYPLAWFEREVPSHEAQWGQDNCCEQIKIKVLNWESLMRGCLADLDEGVPLPLIARKFHITLANTVGEIVDAAGASRVVLSGGCFQNRLLTELVVEKLERKGIPAFIHQRIPPNDGGVAVGQVIASVQCQRKEP